jgi:glycosyltransferase involved in cell wall biosynthesis
MRVGLVAPPWLPVPPGGYGGTEAVIDLLARSLVHRGHEVLLFTVGTSTCPVPTAYRLAEGSEPMGASLPEAAHVVAAYDALEAAGVDLVHDHTVLGPLVARGRARVPVVVTQHNPFTDEARAVLRAAEDVWVVAISRDQASRAGDVPVAAVIHHAVDLDAYRPGPGRADPPYLAFVGRMAPEKGVACAITIAQRSGLPLKLTSKMRDPAEVEYYERVVRALLPPEQRPPPELSFADRVAMVQGALALVDPIEWPEPFGLVMAESLAVGTPVVAFDHGAAAEIVEHGVTGFVVHDEDEAVAALREVPRLDRRRCRRSAELRFSPARMAAEHEALYARVLTARGARPAPLRAVGT